MIALDGMGGLRMYFVEELKRRNVIRVAVVYLATSWLIIQIAQSLFAIFEFPAEWIRLFIILLIICFPLVLLFAWVYELTPEGFRREKKADDSTPAVRPVSKGLDRAIIIIMGLALGYFAIDKFMIDPARDSSELAAARQQGRSEALSEWRRDSSIAVLPFSDFSPRGDHSYFSDGLAEELLNLLARVPGLRVTSRTSSFSFAGKAVDIPAIASALKVAYILEGSIQRSENRIRVTAQLIDTEKDAHVWSQTYDREMADVFSMQDEIAALVIDSLRITLASAAPQSTPTDPEAFSLYLQARHLWRRGSAESVENAHQKLQQVLVLDPLYVPAWDGLSTVYTYMVDTGALPFEEGYAKARDAAHRALEIDPRYAMAHSHLGWDAMIFAGDYAAAAAHFRTARHLAPNNPAVLGNSATLLALIGRPLDAIELLNKTLSMDPIDSVIYTNLGAFHMAANQLDEADAAIEKALELSPDDVWALQAMIYLRILQNRPEDALKLYGKMDENNSELAMLSMIYHDLGRQSEADETLAEYESLYGDTLALNIAENYAWQGRSDEAFAWLQKAYDEGQSIRFLRTSAFLKRLLKDPRWDEFLAGLGLAEHQVSGIEW